MARLLTHGALVATALILQLTVLDLLPFPGGTAPDLVLLVVVAIALTGGPLPGLVAGFAAGLALDLAPPASHAIGAYALVFCVTGYACGRAAGEMDQSAFLPLAAMALGAACGSVLYTVVGVTFGEPGVTWAAARNVLPPSVAYDVLLSPFVLYLVLRLTRWAGQHADDPAVALGRAGSAAVPHAAGRGGGGWGASSKNQPREPRLRPGMGGSAGRIGTGAVGLLAASGRSVDGWAGGAGATAWHSRRQSPLPRFRFGQARPPAGDGGMRPARPPRLRLGQQRRTGTPARPTSGVFTGGSLVGGSQVRLRLGTSRASRLRSRTGRVFGLRPHSHQPARPKFTAAQASSSVLRPGALAAGHADVGRSRRRRPVIGRYGSSRSGLARLLRAPRLRHGRMGHARMGGPRPAAPRFGGSRSGRSRYGASGLAGRRSGAGTGFRRSWLSRLRPRGGWLAIWRPGGRRTGGFR
jgi:rod shape-determining protein MreD